MRPETGKRKFISRAVEDTIIEVKKAVSDKVLAGLFENCFPNTLDTTVDFRTGGGSPDTFIITGDINAMWLRDSTAQVFPYIRFANEDSDLKELLIGVINRQKKSILLDPYANAFKADNTESPWKDDLTEMKPGVFERKWELDSLCYHIRLVYNFWKITGDSSFFDKEWEDAGKLIYKTFVEQQRKENPGPYKFARITSWSTDTVPGGGFGNPVRPVGLIASVFRPSDDATLYPFHIPSNFFALVSLRQMGEIFEKVFMDKKFAGSCVNMSLEIEEALKNFSSSEHPVYGRIYAYEVDGFGNKLFMDDANIPSLLSLPYLGCCGTEDPFYINTRRFVLSEANPYFFSGKAAEGVGSPHTLENKIWHLAVIMRALTSNDEEEIIHALYLLKTTNAGTGFMHEAFDKDNAENYTRGWFSWANTLFGELILKLYDERPDILKRKFINN